MVAEQPEILIVDDEEQGLVSLQMMLQIAGYQRIETRQDSRGVPALLQEQRPTIGLIDLAMPHLSGHDLLRSFRQICPDVPVIVVTASNEISTAVTCLKEGAFDYLVKPVSRERLLPAVERAVELSDLRQENRSLKQFLITDDPGDVLVPDAAQNGEVWPGILRNARKEFRFLVERVPVPVFVSAAGISGVGFCNGAYARFFGYQSSAEAVEAGAWLLDYLVTEDCAQINQSMESRIPVNGARMTGRRPDGSYFTIVLSCEAEDDGYWTGSFIDISEQVALERQFLQAQKMDAIGRFASGIAHDFNNVLTTVLGSSDMILLETGISDAVAEHGEAIKKAAKSAACLTRQLLAFGRLDDAESVQISAHRVIDDTKSWLLRLIDTGIQVEFNLESESDILTMNENYLHQILMNLTVNASDAIDGAGTITIGTRTVHVKPGENTPEHKAPPGVYLELSLSDTGCGMDNATKARLFEPFFTTKDGGTGLGLATVFRIVEQYRGAIDVQSEPDRGTVVAVLLPLDPEALV